ncbi:MAG: hypothetical protein GX115_14890 [Ruminiclostridium sp.]|nr:hypothetical protein [Ruminiclostridium sp.]
MLKNAPILVKLSIAMIVPIIALLLVSVLALIAINSSFNDMRDRIYHQNYGSISLVLNADRDMYQAMVALQQMKKPDASVLEIADSRDDLQSNLTDVRTRIQQAQDKFPKDDQYWSTHRDKNNK